MRLLILGGTLYLGRHLVDAARAHGHEVTLFHRGRTNPGLFPDVEAVLGDRTRDEDLARLKGRRWDAVIDTSGYLPTVVRASAELLRPACEHYTFVSSISVYQDSTQPGLTEDDPVAPLPANAPDEVTGETYGPYKAICEGEVAERFPGSALVVRAGLIFGPHDATERSAYWPVRVARGGEVLAPGDPDRPIQLVDVRDLAGWIVRGAERRLSGTYNATGPDTTLTMGAFLTACRVVAGSDATLVWMDEAFLLEQQVGPFSELPIWVPRQYHAFETVDCRRAWRDELTFRPLAETLSATLEWARSLPPGPRTRSMGVAIPGAMTPEREQEVLAAWRQRAGAAPA